MNHVGFNITENRLQLVEVVEKSKIYFLENVDEEIFSEVLNFQSSDFINILQSAMNNLTQRNPSNSKKASIALPIDLFRIFPFPVETALSEDELNEQINWEFSILFPTLSIKDHIIRTKKISKSINSHPEILVIAIELKPVKALYEFLLKNNLVMQFIDYAHFTSDLLIRRNSSISVYVSKNAVSCSCYLNKELVGFRRFAINNNTKLSNYLGELISNENNELNDFFISGDVEFDSLQKYLEDSLQISFSIISPFNRIQLSDTLIQNDSFMNRANLFSSAAGICFRVS